MKPKTALFKCLSCGKATPEEEAKIQDKNFKFLCAKCKDKKR
jgi:DNA-directed RNA polymerase subunit M/transcription elongation factor TFIIS